jgi:hypothetical protein
MHHLSRYNSIQTMIMRKYALYCISRFPAQFSNYNKTALRKSPSCDYLHAMLAPVFLPPAHSNDSTAR